MVVHMIDCTYCGYRKVIPKAIKGKYEMEQCALTNARIPGPHEPGRWCEAYKHHSECNNDNTIVIGG